MGLDPFVVGVARLRTQLGATASCDVGAVFDPDAELAATSPGESEVPPGGLARFDGELESIPQGIVASGTVTSSWIGVCRRCAIAVGGEISAFVRERFMEGVGPDDEEAYVLDGDFLDLRPLIRDAVVLELPLAPLCKEDCLGLCVQCGADRNLDPCDCEAPADPRWATLDVLRRPD
jgi:uncharacterized protein